MTVAMSCFAHHALQLETEGLVEMSGASVVFEDVKEESMRAEVAKGNAHQFLENAPAKSLPGYRNYDALDFNGARVLADAAQDGVCLHLAPFRFADVIAGVAAGEGGVVTLFAPLADKFAGQRGAFESDDGGDIVESGKAEQHVGWVHCIHVGIRTESGNFEVAGAMGFPRVLGCIASRSSGVRV